jgi:hypothetical protein
LHAVSCWERLYAKASSKGDQIRAHTEARWICAANGTTLTPISKRTLFQQTIAMVMIPLIWLGLMTLASTLLDVTPVVWNETLSTESSHHRLLSQQSSILFTKLVALQGMSDTDRQSWQ